MVCSRLSASVVRRCLQCYRFVCILMERARMVMRSSTTAALNQTTFCRGLNCILLSVCLTAISQCSPA